MSWKGILGAIFIKIDLFKLKRALSGRTKRQAADKQRDKPSQPAEQHNKTIH